MLTLKQQKIVKALQGDLPLVPDLYAALAQQLGMSEGELLDEIALLQRRGCLKRIGAVLYHRRAGFTHNAMVVWRVASGDLEQVGEIMARSPRTTHVYQRETREGWPYTLYTMVHGQSRGECEAAVRELAQAAGVEEYLVLFSTREFKKTSMAYF